MCFFFWSAVLSFAVLVLYHAAPPAPPHHHTTAPRMASLLNIATPLPPPHLQFQGVACVQGRKRETSRRRATVATERVVQVQSLIYGDGRSWRRSYKRNRGAYPVSSAEHAAPVRYVSPSTRQPRLLILLLKKREKKAKKAGKKR